MLVFHLKIKTLENSFFPENIGCAENELIDFQVMTNKEK